MTKRQRKDLLHYVVGAVLMYLIGVATHFSTYTTEGKYIGVPLLSLFLGAFVGFGWELYHWIKSGAYMDEKDILRTMTGFLIGGMLATL